MACSDLQQRLAMPTRSPASGGRHPSVAANPTSTPKSTRPAARFRGPSASRPAPTGLSAAHRPPAHPGSALIGPVMACRPAPTRLLPPVDGRSAAQLGPPSPLGRLAAPLSGSQAAPRSPGPGVLGLSTGARGAWATWPGPWRLMGSCPCAHGLMASASWCSWPGPQPLGRARAGRPRPVPSPEPHGAPAQGPPAGRGGGPRQFPARPPVGGGVSRACSSLSGEFHRKQTDVRKRVANPGTYDGDGGGRAVGRSAR